MACDAQLTTMHIGKGKYPTELSVKMLGTFCPGKVSRATVKGKCPGRGRRHTLVNTHTHRQTQREGQRASELLTSSTISSARK